MNTSSGNNSTVITCCIFLAFGLRLCAQSGATLPLQALTAPVPRLATDQDIDEILRLNAAGFSDALVIQQVKSEGKLLLFSGDQRNTLAVGGVHGLVVIALGQPSDVAPTTASSADSKAAGIAPTAASPADSKAAAGAASTSDSQDTRTSSPQAAPPPVIHSTLKSDLDNARIIELSQKGLGDAVIIAKINSSATHFHLSDDDLANLKKGGVSDSVVAVMIQSTPSMVPDLQKVDGVHDPVSGVVRRDPNTGLQSAPAFTSKAVSDTTPITAIERTPSILPEVAGRAACPSAKGIYFYSDGKWIEMERIHADGLHTTGVAKSTFSYGIAPMKIKATFRDAKAPAQLSGPDFVFCSVDVAEQGRDVVLVRLDEGTRQRELEMATVRAWTGFSTKYKDDRVIATTIQKQSSTIFVMAVSGSLRQGEYILFPKPFDLQQGAGGFGPTAVGGYDFGFHHN